MVILLKICAVIPAYNEEENIGSVVSETRKYVDSVVVVDDGSTDNTSFIAETTGAVVVRHDINKGYGAAIRSCFEAARKFNADIMVILDGDGQHDPRYIPKLINPIMNNGIDIVIGSRFLSISNDIPAYRKFGMNLLNVITSIFSRENLDSQSGFRAYSKKAIHLLNPVEEGMGVSSEILIEANEKKLNIEQVSIKVRYDTGKPSKNPIDHGLSVIVSVIRLVGQKHPLLFFGFSGFILSITGISLGGWVINNFNQTHTLPVGMALITSIFVITGIFLMGIGMTIYVIQDTIRRCIIEFEHRDKLVGFALKDRNKSN